MCYEILSLATTFTEVTNRKFDNDTYWGVLSKLATKLDNSFQESNDTNKFETLSKLITSIFEKNTTSSDEYTVDYLLLDDGVTSALAGME